MSEIGVIPAHGQLCSETVSLRTNVTDKGSLIVYDSISSDCQKTAELLVLSILSCQTETVLSQTKLPQFKLDATMMLSVIDFKGFSDSLLYIYRDDCLQSTWVWRALVPLVDHVYIIIDGSLREELFLKQLITQLMSLESSEPVFVTFALINTLRPKKSWEQYLLEQVSEIPALSRKMSQLNLRTEIVDCGILNDQFAARIKEIPMKQIQTAPTFKVSGQTVTVEPLVWIQKHYYTSKSTNQQAAQLTLSQVAALCEASDKMECSEAVSRLQDEFRHEIERSIVLKIQSLFTEQPAGTVVQAFTLPSLNTILASYIVSADTAQTSTKLLETLADTVNDTEQLLLCVLGQDKYKRSSTAVMQKCSDLVSWLRQFRPVPGGWSVSATESVDDAVDTLAVRLLSVCQPQVIKK